jgi:hypothetical protein
MAVCIDLNPVSLKRKMETTDYTQDTDLKRVMKVTTPTRRVNV